MSETHLYGEDLNYVDQLLNRLTEFTRREQINPEEALVLDPSGGWHRYLVHQAVLLFPSLASFSVGDGAGRRPVICFASKYKRQSEKDSSSSEEDERRPARRLYVPPNRTSGSSTVAKSRGQDDRLQGQLLARLKIVESKENDFSRVPDLNPHAPTFIPTAQFSAINPSLPKFDHQFYTKFPLQNGVAAASKGDVAPPRSSGTTPSIKSGGGGGVGGNLFGGNLRNPLSKINNSSIDQNIAQKSTGGGIQLTNKKPPSPYQITNQVNSQTNSLQAIQKSTAKVDSHVTSMGCNPKAIPFIPSNVQGPGRLPNQSMSKANSNLSQFIHTYSEFKPRNSSPTQNDNMSKSDEKMASQKSVKGARSLSKNENRESNFNKESNSRDSGNRESNSNENYKREKERGERHHHTKIIGSYIPPPLRKKDSNVDKQSVKTPEKESMEISECQHNTEKNDMPWESGAKGKTSSYANFKKEKKKNRKNSQPDVQKRVSSSICCVVSSPHGVDSYTTSINYQSSNSNENCCLSPASYIHAPSPSNSLHAPSPATSLRASSPSTPLHAASHENDSYELDSELINQSISDYINNQGDQCGGDNQIDQENIVDADYDSAGYNEGNQEFLPGGDFASVGDLAAECNVGVLSVGDEVYSGSNESLEIEDWADDECEIEPLDQNCIDEISRHLPGLNVSFLKRPCDIATPAHMLEIYDFPKAVRTHDLLEAFSQYYSGFSVRWVDDTHAIAIFASKNQAEKCLTGGGCGMFRVRELVLASDEARRKAAFVAREQQCDVDPYCEPAPRPETSMVVARRLIAANVDERIAKQLRQFAAAAEREEKIIKHKARLKDQEECEIEPKIEKTAKPLRTSKSNR